VIATRQLKVLSLALLLSGASVVATQQWMHSAVRRATAEAAAKTGPAAIPSVQVLVAATHVPAGAIIKPGEVRWQPWPANAPTAGYLTSATTRPEQMTGAVARANLEAGEPLTPARVVQPGERSFLAAVLQPGYRAITVNVTASSGVAGFVMAGDHVDLILNLSVNAPNGDRRVGSETILQDVRVLAMDQRGGEAKDAKKDVIVPQTATLEVTPKGAEIIGAATQVGPLSLSLRSLAEPQTPAPLERTVTHTSIADALGVDKLKPAARPATPRRAPGLPAVVVQVFRGGQPVSVTQTTGGAP
jgi:pilus assembly protein CpaB